MPDATECEKVHYLNLWGVMALFEYCLTLSYDVINMATIMRNCSLIKAMVCVGMVILIQHERFFNIISIILVI